MKLDYSGILDAFRKHSPEILTGVGIAGMIFTTVHAVMKTPEAMQKLDGKRLEVGRDKLTVKETVQAVWKAYILDVMTCTASAACLVCATTEGTRRNAALSAAYVLSESKISRLEEFKGRAQEIIGEEKAQEIERTVTKEQVRRDPPSKKDVIMVSGGEVLCCDSITGRYFQSNTNILHRAENILNRRMLNENYISLNDFYYEIGLEDTKVGDDLGWNINDGLIELYFTSIVTDGGIPCLVVNYEVKPRANFLR